MANVTKIGITINKELLARMEEYADNNYLSKSGLISIAVTQYLNAQEVYSLLNKLAVACDKIAADGNVDEETQKQLDDLSRVANVMLGAKK